MKHHYKTTLCRLKAGIFMLVLMLSGLGVKAQTSLSVGDIAFAGYISADDAGVTQDDAFSFILMKDIQANTEIYFTDLGWTDNNAFQEVDPCGPFTGSYDDGIIKWTATSDLTCGTQITIQCKTLLTANTGTVTGEQSTANNIFYYIDLPTVNGDQLFAYQGSTGSPSFIAGIAMNNNWEVNLDACTHTSSLSVLPIDLFSNNVIVFPDAVNAVYNSNVTSGSALATAILDGANWNTDLSTSLPIPSANNLPLAATFTPCAVANAPTITSQPVSVNACESDTVSFSISAIDYTSVQWQYYDGSNWINMTDTGAVSGSNDTTLVFSHVPYSYNGMTIRCIVTGNALPDAISNLAFLSLTKLPAITSFTPSRAVCEGDNCSFNVQAPGGNGTYTYQWQIDTGSGFVNLTNGGAYSGVLTKTVVITNATPAMNLNFFRCIITGPCGPSTISTPVSMQVNIRPVLTLQPVSSTICLGSNTTFSTNATGSFVNFQWQIENGGVFTNLVSNTVYSGTGGKILTITNPGLGLDGTRYRCLATGTCSPVAITDTVTLRVKATPSVPTFTSGTSVICSATNGEAYTINGIQGANNYNWTITGNDITSTIVDTTATVNFGENATSAIISVNASNQCGTSGNASINVVVNPSYHYYNPIYICPGDSTEIDGTWYSSNTTLTESNLTIFGCDSNYITEVVQVPSYDLHFNVTLCDGDSVFANGAWQTTAGTYNDVLVSSFGCDSLVETIVNISFPDQVNQFLSACEGDSLFLEGNWQFVSGTYVDHFTNIGGCDSMVTTELTVNPTYLFTQNSSICAGSSLFFGGNFIFTSGTYYDTHQTTLGCDSTYVLNLVVNPLPLVTLAMDTTVCTTQSPITLYGESPSGGTWSGAGVSGNQFDPSSIGAGSYEILYTYFDNNGCSATVSDTITVTVCSGLNQISKSNWNLYPNPVHDQLRIKTDATAGEYNISIYSVDGKLIEKTRQTIVNEAIINTSKLSEGSYMITLEGPEGSLSMRFVK
jgi:hypothetical protein